MTERVSFRQLFAMTGPLYIVITVFARLPYAMSQMGMLFLITDATGTYAQGGLCAGALAISVALCSPVSGALTDRFGQRRVVLVQSLLAGSAFLAAVPVAALVKSGQLSWWFSFALAALAGMFIPQIGPLARVRWREITRAKGGRGLETAFSWEGAVDEGAFVLGPACAGLLAAAVSAGGAVLASGVLLLIFGSAYAIHPTAAMVAGHGGAARGGQDGFLSRELLLLLAGMFAVGTIFGSVQNGSLALATANGLPSMAGVLHGILGIGSASAGLGVSLLPARFKLPDRLLVFSSVFLVLTVPVVFVNTVPVLAAVLLFMGVAIGPFMITVMTMAERVTHPTRLGATLSALSSFVSLGYAFGAALAGRLADWGGYRPSFMLVLAACACTVLIAATTRHLFTPQAGDK